MSSAFRASALGLNEDFRARRVPLGFGADRAGVGADHDGDRRSAGLADRRQHVREHGLSRDLMQHLRARRAHAGAFAGGEHDRKACSLGHRVSRGSCDDAVLSEQGAAKKADCAGDA
jgi:hypothetical protein